MMTLLEKIELYLNEEVVVGGSSGGEGMSNPGTTTGDIAKFPEKFVVGYKRRKKKKKKDKKESVT